MDWLRQYVPPHVTDADEPFLRGFLGKMLFSGDDVMKKTNVLSGGEKARVALAKTITSKANFLLLDEPTNHLDIHSVELLIDALNRYEGSMILVSHDRYFISKTANKIWEIKDHQIKEFKGTYDEWVAWNERMDKAAASNKTAEKPAPKPAEKKTEAPKPAPQNTSVNSAAKKELQRQQRIFAQLEEKLAKLNAEKQKLELALAAPDTYQDVVKFKQTETDYQKVTEQLAGANAEYEKVFDAIVTLEGELNS